MTSPYDWWMSALEMAGDYGKLTRDQMMTLGLHEDEPQCGFWRTQAEYKTDSYLSEAFVAIWPAPDGLHALWNGTPIQPEAAWAWCAPFPIDEDTYRRMELQGFRQATGFYSHAPAE